MRSGTAEGNRARGTRGGGKQRRWKTENPVLRLPACLLARPCPQSRERSQSKERTRPEPGGNGWVGTTQELGYDALDGGGCGRERNDAQLETRAETAKRWVRSKDDRGSEEPGAAMVWTTAPCEACGNRGAGGDFWGGQEDWGKETPGTRAQRLRTDWSVTTMLMAIMAMIMPATNLLHETGYSIGPNRAVVAGGVADTRGAA